MKRMVAAALLLSLGGAHSASAQTIALKGSDTLEKVTKQLLANPACNPGNAIEYAGGGSGTGEAAMVNNQQQIAPMSRALVACGSAGSTAENLAIGYDSIILATNSASACTGPGATWPQTLRTLFAGADGSGSTAACGDAARLNLANNFNGAMTTCSAGGCTKIWHLFRRGDASGTTDAFKTILEQNSAKITAFCNGTETQDKDPIRRTCRPEEEVCQGDGTLGLLLPIVVTTTEGVATANEDDLWYRTSGNPANVRKCKTGKFVRVNPSFTETNCCLRARSGDTTSTCLAKPIAGKCLWPNTADLAGQTANAMCNNAKTNDCFGANKPGTYINVKDGRAFNLTLRGAGPNYAILKDALNKEQASSFFRLRWTGKGQTWSCTSQTTYGTACQELDSTRQIGCLSKQTHPAAGTNTLDCDVGFAGDEARAVAGAYAPNVNNQAPTANGNINLSYPLKRKLYLNTLKGFENLTAGSAERALAVCFGTATTINPILTANGFSPLLDNGSDPKCEAASCGSANACTGNPSPWQ